MTIDVGPTRAELAAAARALAQGALVGTTCQVMTNSMEYVSRFTPRILSGQVNIDATTWPTRQLTMTAFDPDAQIDVDLRDGSPRLDRMIRIYYDVFVEEKGIGWVQIPIFTGPVVSVKRGEDGIVEVQGVGKEEFGRKPCGQTRVYPKGTNRVRLIMALMRDLSGERTFLMPEGWKARTAKNINIGTGSHPWSHARTQARALGADLWYDGKGILRLRSRPTRPAFVFRSGEGGTVLTEPNVSEDADGIVNTVVVTGAVPKGRKNPIRWTEHLPKSDPYSSWSLGRHGVRSFYFDRVEDDSIRSKAEAKRVARQRIKQARIEVKQVQFDSIPVPFLQENDPIRIETRDVQETVRLRQMSIPLGHDGVSTVGYIGQVKKSGGRRRFR